MNLSWGCALRSDDCGTWAVIRGVSGYWCLTGLQDIPTSIGTSSCPVALVLFNSWSSSSSTRCSLNLHQGVQELLWDSESTRWWRLDCKQTTAESICHWPEPFCYIPAADCYRRHPRAACTSSGLPAAVRAACRAGGAGGDLHDQPGLWRGEVAVELEVAGAADEAAKARCY